MADLEVRLGDSRWLLSARRLWEFGEYGQPMDLRAAVRTTAAEAIDLVDCSGGRYVLTGLTLADVEKGKGPAGLELSVPASGAVRTLRSWAGAYLRRLRLARAQRRGGEAFAAAATAGPLRVRGLHSRLQARLASTAGSFPPAQWLGTIANYTRSGIPEEEISLSGVREFLAACDPSARVTGPRLAQACTFARLQLSMLSEASAARAQLRLVPAPQKTYRTVKGARRVRQPGSRTTLWVDPSLGYRLDRIEHDALWGRDVSWQAVDEAGVPISGHGGPRDHTAWEDAEVAAAADAALRYPKHIASSRWQRWCWGGGESYREWLLTAPGLPVGYFSSHFDVRNLLLHLRVDVRQTAAGDAVLFVQEVQSDWAQGAASRHTLGSAGVKEMPFAREWTLLAAKLVLLEAASLGVARIAWTTGGQQSRRWAGRGETHLRRLYDDVLPREFARLLGSTPQPDALYVPVDFTTRLVEGGYEVVARDGTVLGSAGSLEEAWQFVPDGAREDLVTVHAVAVPEATRSAVLARGFPAWGLPPAVMELAR